MTHEELLESDNLYRMYIEHAQEQSYQEGLQQGIEQAQQLMALLGVIIALITAQYPELLPLAQKVIATISDPQRLQTLFLVIGRLQSQEKVEAALNSLNEEINASNAFITDCNGLLLANPYQSPAPENKEDRYYQRYSFLKGHEAGLEQGIRQVIGCMQEAALILMGWRFPELFAFAEKIITAIDNPLRLQTLILRINDFPDKEEAIQLLDWMGKESSTNGRARTDSASPDDSLSRPPVQGGREEGLQEIQLAIQTTQQAVVSMIVARFPGLRALAEKVISAVKDLQRLQKLVTAINASQMQEQVKRLLDALSEEFSAKSN